MKFSYFNDKGWIDITRDERYFCAELFFEYKTNPKSLIKLLFDLTTIHCITENDLQKDWQLGYEVCFFRDFIYHLNNTNNHKIKIDDYSRKRTFDLCLFSEEKILIIEAKVQSGFNTKQLDDFEKDKIHINNLMRNEGIKLPNTYLIGLASDTYFTNVQKPGKKGIPALIKDNYFTWQNIYDASSSNELFSKGNKLYKN